MTDKFLAKLVFRLDLIWLLDSCNLQMEEGMRASLKVNKLITMEPVIYQLTDVGRGGGSVLHNTGMFKQSIRDRNRVGIGFSYRPRQVYLESISRLLKGIKI
jgi:hypothetical protein